MADILLHFPSLNAHTNRTRLCIFDSPKQSVRNNIRRTMGESYARFEILVNVDIMFHD